MGVTLPGESPEYRVARGQLLEREIELRRAMEAVAAARRELPPGGVVPEDYVFQGAGADGRPSDVRLSELFAPGKDSLVIYSFMFPRDPGDERPGPAGGQTALLPLAEGPCPSCVAFLDQLDGAAEHASQQLNLAVVAKAPLPRVLAFAEERGWRRLRLLSSAANSYNRDYHAEWEPPLDQSLGTYRFQITANRYTIASRPFDLGVSRALTPRRVPAPTGKVAIVLDYPRAKVREDVGDPPPDASASLTFRPPHASSGVVTFVVDGRAITVGAGAGGRFEVSATPGDQVEIRAGDGRDADGNRTGQDFAFQA